MNNWISVKDKLPEEKQDVILCINARKTTIGYRYGEESFYEFCLEAYPIGPGRVTHWMELPESPND
jgi:hypothetical protein